MAEMTASFYEFSQWLYEKETECGVKGTHLSRKFIMEFLIYFAENCECDENGEKYISCTYKFLGTHLNTGKPLSLNRAQTYVDMLTQCGIIRVESKKGRVPSKFYLLDCPFVKD